MNARDTIFQDLDNLVANGYAADWDGTGQSIYDAEPMAVMLDAIEQTGVEYASLDDAARFVAEWQALK